jgi:predicted DNA-binding protein (MmcQ/YjbR family)
MWSSPLLPLREHLSEKALSSDDDQNECRFHSRILSGISTSHRESAMGRRSLLQDRREIFTIVGLDNPRLCFKCTPEIFAELIEREDIHPAPYVGRYKWVMLDRLDAVRWDELRELIRQPYEMVGAKAPKKTSGRKREAAKVRHRKKKSQKSKRR